MRDPIFVGSEVELRVECVNALTGQPKRPTSLSITIKPPVGPKVVKTWPDDAEVQPVAGTVATFTWIYPVTKPGTYAWSAFAQGALVGPGDGGTFSTTPLSTD